MRLGCLFVALLVLMAAGSWRAGAATVLPAHKIYQLRNGLALHYIGGIGPGSAADLKRALDAVPNAVALYLESGGGILLEADLMRQMIRARGMITYTDTECASACTIVFMGGVVRYLGPRGKIGFHRPSADGASAEELQDSAQILGGAMSGLGIDDHFTARAMSVPSAQIWFPTNMELLNAHVVTAFVQNDNFPLSRWPGSNQAAGLYDGGYIDSMLEADPAALAIKRYDPALYQQMRSSLISDLTNGAAKDDMFGRVQRVITEAVHKYTPNASDEALVKLMEWQLAEGRVLQPYPELCADFFSGRSDNVIIDSHLPEKLKKAYAPIAAEIIASGAVQPFAVTVNTATTTSLNEQISRQLTAQYGPQGAQMLEHPRDGGRGDPRTFCSLQLDLFLVITSLPVEQAGPLIRTIIH